MRRLLIILAGVAVFYAYSTVVWINGFDGGAAAAQCLDFHATLGAKDAMTKDACKEAAERQRGLTFKVLGHRVFFQ